MNFPTPDIVRLLPNKNKYSCVFRALLPERSKSSKYKSPVARRTVNPQWRHTFVFNGVSGEDLRERALELTVWDHDRFSSNSFLGGVRLGSGTGAYCAPYSALVCVSWF